jgi:hypothetical protein
MSVHTIFKWLDITPFPRAFVLRFGELLISHVALWKELRLNQWFDKDRHKRQ